MRNQLRALRLLLALVVLLVGGATLSNAGVKNARRVKADLEQAYPGVSVRITNALWVQVRCGSFRFAGEAQGAAHRFIDDGGTLETDIGNSDPADFDSRWDACERQHGRGEFQNPLFNALVLPWV